jgi:L-lactate utilization protein LutB
MAKTTQSSAMNLMAEAGADPQKWNLLPSLEIVERTTNEIRNRGSTVVPAENGDDALAILKTIIPAGPKVINGSFTASSKLESMNWLPVNCQDET